MSVRINDNLKNPISQLCDESKIKPADYIRSRLADCVKHDVKNLHQVKQEFLYGWYYPVIRGFYADNTGTETSFLPIWCLFSVEPMIWKEADKKHTSWYIKVCNTSGKNSNYCLFFNHLHLTYPIFFSIIHASPNYWNARRTLCRKGFVCMPVWVPLCNLVKGN